VTVRAMTRMQSRKRVRVQETRRRRALNSTGGCSSCACVQATQVQAVQWVRVHACEPCRQKHNNAYMYTRTLAYTQLHVKHTGT
jgi:hypothetical protein